jgi:hypothetical protein
VSKNLFFIIHTLRESLRIAGVWLFSNAQLRKFAGSAGFHPGGLPNTVSK